MRSLAPCILLASCALLALLALLAGPAAATLMPIQPDGDFADWSAVPLALTDTSGDDGSSGIDFGSVWVANDQDYLYIRFETGADVQPDEEQQMRLYLDTDMNAGTGYYHGGIGAELVWEFGERQGTFYRGGTAYIYHNDVGLLMMPTVSSTQFEIALARDAVPANGQSLFPGDTVRFLLRDAGSGGDLVPDSGGISYTFSEGSIPVESLSLAREDAAHIRLQSWNVENDGLFEGGSAEAAQGRLLNAVDPDILVINEVWNHSALEVRNKIEEHLPSGAGESWYALKRDSGNVVCSRFPILNSWEVNPGYRITAVLVDLGDDPLPNLLVIACHWRCCTADDDRQHEADSIIEFLADAKTLGGAITLPEGTPFVLAGDLNLVGLGQQLDTILTGDIINELYYGPDAAPDWDDQPFAPVMARHPDARRADTWWNDYSSYYPGKLDWIFYTDSVLDLKRNFVLETRTMTSATRAANGLYTFDTTYASDHASIVADFALFDTTSGVGDLPGATSRVRLLPSAPNPFNPQTTIAFDLPADMRVHLSVYDISGRLVDVLLADEMASQGRNEVIWRGRDARGRGLPSGTYFTRLEAGGTVKTTRMTLLK